MDVNFTVKTEIEHITTYLDGLPESVYDLETTTIEPTPIIQLMTGVSQITIDPEGTTTITYTDGYEEEYKYFGFLIEDFDNFFAIISTFQSLRDKKSKFFTDPLIYYRKKLLSILNRHISKLEANKQ